MIDKELALGVENDDVYVMEKLMQGYESELANPVRGLIFGNLMTAMLIQVKLLVVNLCLHP